jgi:hypothetical protein
MAEIHDFNQSKIAGDEGEQFLDRFFEQRGNKVESVTMEEQKRDKVDRRITNIKSGYVALTEYKTDEKAKQTGNIFVETFSNAEYGTAGWIGSSVAEWLVTLIPDECILITRLAKVRECYATKWYSRNHKSVPNEVNGNIYHTIGAIVPIEKYIKESGAVKIGIAPQQKSAASH